MLFLDGMINGCSDPALAAILLVIKRVMNIVWIVGPILVMVGAIVVFTKLMTNPEEKKYKPLLRNMIIALLMLFLIPTIVNTVMKLFDDQFEVSSCWNHAEEVVKPSSTPGYIDDNKKPPTNIYTDPDDYTVNEGGDSNGPSPTPSYSPTPRPTEGPTVTSGKVIFVGDSRTVGMKQAVGSSSSNDVWSCQTSMGFDWMKNTGIPNISRQITSGSSLVILMGVNDLYHVNSYISYINDLAPQINARGAKLYFVSVNPTSKGRDSLNKDINEFNKKMKSGLSSSVKYIDTNSYLTANGFSSNDGLHYTADTYNKIYAYIKSNL